MITRTATMDLSRLVDDWLYTTAWADRIAQSATIQDLAGLYRPGDPTERK